MRYMAGALRIFAGAWPIYTASSSFCCVGHRGDGTCDSIDEVTSLLQFQGIPDEAAVRGKEEKISAANLQRRLGISKEARRSFVSRLMNHVNAIAKQDSTPEAMVVASEELEQVYLVALPFLNAEHLQDKRSLRGFFDAFGSVASELLHAEGSLRELESRSATARAEHLQCRVLESSKCEQRAKCESEFQELQSTLAYLEERGEARDESESKRDIESQFTTEALNTKADECLSHHEKCGESRDVCGLKQKNLEVASCAAGQQVDHMRLQYVDNFTNAISTYQEAASEIQVEEANRKAELEMLQELHCVQEQFAAGLDSIDECRAMQHNVSSLDIIYAEAPARVELPAVIARPCTQEFVSVAYGSLPSGAPAAECKSCSEWQPDVTKLQAEVSSLLENKAHATLSGTQVMLEDSTRRFHKKVPEEFHEDVSREFLDGYAEGYQSGVKTLEREVSAGMPSVDFGEAAEAFEAGIAESSDASFEQASEIPGSEYGSHKDLAQGFAKGFQRGFAVLREGVQKSIQKVGQASVQQTSSVYREHAATVSKLLILDFEEGYEKGIGQSVEQASARPSEDLRRAFWGTFQHGFESTINRGWDRDLR